MRRVFALLMTFALVVSFLVMPAYALEDVNGDKGGNSKNNSGGSTPTPVVGEGQQKDFGSNNGTESSEETEPSETEAPPTEPSVTAPSETEPTEPQVSETEPVITEAAATEPDPNTVLGDGQRQKVTEPAAETEPAVEATEDPTEMFLLVALITGLGAICVVLLIRRVLDL